MREAKAFTILNLLKLGLVSFFADSIIIGRSGEDLVVITVGRSSAFELHQTGYDECSVKF